MSAPLFVSGADYQHKVQGVLMNYIRWDQMACPDWLLLVAWTLVAATPLLDIGLLLGKIWNGKVGSSRSEVMGTTSKSSTKPIRKDCLLSIIRRTASLELSAATADKLFADLCASHCQLDIRSNGSTSGAALAQ